MADRQVEVIVRLAGQDILAGQLWSHRRRATESATFAYDTSYLSRPGAYELDPALPLVEGQQQTAEGRAMFAAFTDCTPDRWGRQLIVRAEQQRAREEGGTGRSFGEIDYLLGARDDLRQGALRFRDSETGVFLADERSGVPALIELPRLLEAADRVEGEDADEDDFATLLHGGSSLGGARPKAHMQDASGPAIAKFPRPSTDDWDVMRWEAVALSLAESAGIWVPRSRLVDVDGRAVLVVERFDREGMERIGYVSAMTMLEAKDGDTGSYLDIAGVIETNSPATTDDLQQLWRRIAFSILISNTDDHLRNHGFLRRLSSGWSLSPAFDLNPDPDPGPKHLRTAINFDDTEARIETLMEVSDVFRMQVEDAQTALAEIKEAVDGWRTVAESVGLEANAIEQMAPAFEHEQAIAAGRIAQLSRA